MGCEPKWGHGVKCCGHENERETLEFQCLYYSSYAKYFNLIRHASAVVIKRAFGAVAMSAVKT